MSGSSCRASDSTMPAYWPRERRRRVACRARRRSRSSPTRATGSCRSPLRRRRRCRRRRRGRTSRGNRSSPSRLRMNSVCDTPRSRPNDSSTRALAAFSASAVAIAVGQRARDEDAAFVRHRHRRRAVAAGRGEDDRVDRRRASRRDRRRRGRTARAGTRAARRRAPSRICQSSSADPIFLMPMAAACERGLSTHGGVTRDVHSSIASWLTTWTNSGQGIRAARARERIASLSRKARPVVSPMPGTCRYSRSIAAVSTSKSSSATMRSSRSVRARYAAPLRMSLSRHVAADVVERVDRLARPVGVAQRLVGERAARGSPGGGTRAGTRRPCGRWRCRASSGAWDSLPRQSWMRDAAVFSGASGGLAAVLPFRYWSNQ